MAGILLFAGLIFGCLIPFTAWANEPAPKVLGVGGIMSTSPYVGVGTTTMPIPIVMWEYKGFYIRGLEAGYTFYKKDNLELSVVTAARMMGYHSSDSDDLSGMEDRESSLDSGLRVELALPFKGLALNACIMSDVLSRNDGREASIDMEQSFGSKYLRIKTAAGVKAQSSGLADYYYGVRGEEARAGRPEYRTGHAVNPFAGVTLMTGISKQWLIFSRAHVEFFDTAIRRSPIVEERYTVTGLLGIARRF